MQVSKKLAEFISSTGYVDFSPQVIHAFKRSFLDYLCVTITGSQMEIAISVHDYLKSIDHNEQSCVVGTAVRLSPPNAAFANGTSCHAVDFDDGYTRGSFHPAAPCISAVLAATEPLNSAPQDFLKAVVIAYDIALRISGNVHPYSANRGFHNTGTVGVFGAAAGVSSLLALNVDQTINALGAAGSFAGGLREFLAEGDEGGEIKRIHPAKAARDGLLSAELALRGITAPKTILEGKYGFFRSFAGIELDPDQFFNGLGETFEITNCYFKPFPVCKHLHGTIEAIREIKKEAVIKPEDIDKVEVKLYAVGVHSHDYPKCDSLIAAQMNHPPVAALAICYDDVTLENLQSGFNDGVKDVMKKVDVSVCEECEKEYPAQRPTVVTIRCKNGTILSKKVFDPRGEAVNPLSDQDLEDKFYSNCEPIIGAEKCKTLVDAVWQFDQLKNLDLFYIW